MVLKDRMKTLISLAKMNTSQILREIQNQSSLSPKDYEKLASSILLLKKGKWIEKFESGACNEALGEV